MTTEQKLVWFAVDFIEGLGFELLVFLLIFFLKLPAGILS
jgi:hypothetical protein